jgi:hypothetical protein
LHDDLKKGVFPIYAQDFQPFSIRLTGNGFVMKTKWRLKQEPNAIMLEHFKICHTILIPTPMFYQLTLSFEVSILKVTPTEEVRNCEGSSCPYMEIYVKTVLATEVLYIILASTFVFIRNP